jgi:hypothetical protein
MKRVGTSDASDLIATGGSASAAGELIRKAGGKTLEYLFVVGLPFLNGAAKVSSAWSVAADISSTPPPTGWSRLRTKPPTIDLRACDGHLGQLHRQRRQQPKERTDAGTDGLRAGSTRGRTGSTARPPRGSSTGVNLHRTPPPGTSTTRLHISPPTFNSNLLCNPLVAFAIKREATASS